MSVRFHKPHDVLLEVTHLSMATTAEVDRSPRHRDPIQASETVTESVNFHLTVCAAFSTAHLSLILKKHDPMLACPYWLGPAQGWSFSQTESSTAWSNPCPS